VNAGFLTRKVGPLPTWAWGGVAAAAVLVARHFTGGGSSGSGSGDVGAATTGAADVQPGAGAFGGGGDGGGSDLGAPTTQTTADDSLLGPGSATVFDPTGFDSTPLADTTPGNDQGGRTSNGVPYTESAVKDRRVSPHHDATSARPKHTRGQTAKKKRVPGTGKAPELVSEHGRGQVKVARGTRTPQAARPAAAAPARSPAAAHPDAGARPSTVGRTTSAATYARLGRKLERE
jgi:hypothetical protein